MNQTGEKLLNAEIEQIIEHSKTNRILVNEGDLKNARKKTSNLWFETQDSISYWDDFSKQKIVWIELTNNANFCLDDKGYYLNNTVFFIVGDRLPYIVSFLNSKLCEWYFSVIAATSGAGTRRWIKIYIEQICIPQIIDRDIEHSLERIIQDIHQKKILKNSINELERQVNLMIYQLVGLSMDEIEFIDSQ